jgi:uncharacterized protein (TIGR02145 family)
LAGETKWEGDRKMSKIKFISLVATLGLALAFTLSCSSPDDASSNCTAKDNTDTHYCSNGTIKEYGFVIDKGGQTYKTVEIGTQIWMAENLNYDTEGSKCYNESTTNCNKYGRLYYWHTAMALPSNCKDISCASEISAKHQGICPDGFHIPTNANWEVLMQSVNQNCSLATNECDGKRLKAIKGWPNDDWGESTNGTDNYGFAALPGGYGNSMDDFGDAGSHGYLWSASESSTAYGDAYLSAYRLHIFSYGDAIHFESDSKSNLYSVRCVKD